MKKKLNLTVMVLSVLELFLLLLPFMYVRVLYNYNNELFYHESLVEAGRTTGNLFTFFSTPVQLIAVLLFLSILLTAFTHLFLYLKREYQFIRYTQRLPYVSVALLILHVSCAVLFCDDSGLEYETSFRIGWAFYLVALFLVLSCVFTYLYQKSPEEKEELKSHTAFAPEGGTPLESNLPKDASQSSKTEPIKGESTVFDELKKYKELLDVGAITPEEFQHIKEKLLKL